MRFGLLLPFVVLVACRASAPAAAEPTVGNREATLAACTGGIPAADAPPVYIESEVERPVATIGPSPIPPSPGVNGEVLFGFVVDSAGRVELSKVRVVRSTSAAVERSARASLAGVRFRPALLDGRPVAQCVFLPYVFEGY